GPPRRRGGGHVAARRAWIARHAGVLVAAPAHRSRRGGVVKQVVVIGSGFGGAISAKRFTEAGHRVPVLELGGDWTQLAKAQPSQAPRYLFRLLRNYPTDALITKPHLQVTVGMGWGGGSLVYSGIHLRAPSQAFEGWPAGWTREALDPYYA